ncbi:MAG: ElyC/SanA/YdcF family protein [Candidatus Peribacteraceae bacterium]
MKLVRLSIRLTIIAGLVCLTAILASNAIVLSASKGLIIRDIAEAPSVDAILVLGASVYRSGVPSPILEDRLIVAANLYKQKKAPKIIVSGDHGTDRNDEPKAMQRTLIDAGVPAQDIFLDHAGFDTFDSVYRAREIFQASKLLIVSQEFHLPRAVYLAAKLGMDSTGVTSDLRNYGEETNRRNSIREIFARVKGVLDVLLDAKPTYLGDPIPLSGDGRTTDTSQK